MHTKTQYKSYNNLVSSCIKDLNINLTVNTNLHHHLMLLIVMSYPQTLYQSSDPACYFHQSLRP